MEDQPNPTGEYLPLSPAVLHILLSLTAGPMHGYAIMQEVERLSGGKLRMGPGTLYGTIKRMLRDGLIEAAADVPRTDSEDERRRYYRLTETGSRLLSAEANRLESLVAVFREREILTRASPASSGQRRA